jgi:hypothetical protein
LRAEQFLAGVRLPHQVRHATVHEHLGGKAVAEKESEAVVASFTVGRPT